MWSPLFSWVGFTIALIGTLIAAVPLLLGKAPVMYTFYPPEMANTGLYIGAAMLFFGSWFWCVDMIVGMMQWKKVHPGMVVPLVMFGATINALLWLWTSMGATLEVLLQILPLQFGWVDTINPGLAHTFFSWALHAIVYFWLFPAWNTLAEGRFHVSSFVTVSTRTEFEDLSCRSLT